MSSFNAGPAGNRVEVYVLSYCLSSSSLSTELTAARIREMMANAQKTISERKAQLGLAEGNMPDPETMNKMHRTAQLQAQIAEKLNSGLLDNLQSSEAESKYLQSFH